VLAVPPSHAISGCFAATFFICGASTNGLIGTHLIAHASTTAFEVTGAASWR